MGALKSSRPDSSITIVLQRTDWSLFVYRLGSLAAAERNRYVAKFTRYVRS
jgi:hypothetical protein